MKNEEVKAIQELSKFGARTLDSADKLGNFLARVFGTLPTDVVGVVGGDWLHHIRIRNVAKLVQRTEEILRNRGILDKTEPMSPSVALPLLHAAQDETREQLREMWARMLANGMDPNKRDSIRQSVIAAVKSFDPLDALILQRAFDMSPNKGKSADFPEGLEKEVGVTSDDEFELSLSNLSSLGCISSSSKMFESDIHITTGVSLTALGREILRACSP